MSGSDVQDQKVAEYVRIGGTRCPCCGSDQIEGGDIDIEYGCARQEIGCLSCDASWYDVYVLKGFDNLKAGA